MHPLVISPLPGSQETNQHAGPCGNHSHITQYKLMEIK